MDTKQQEYIERHSKWRDIAISQLSFTNNLILTACGTILTLIVDKDVFKALHICISNSINWKIFYYFLSIFFLSISTLYGLSITLCRLYDFRISRHLALIRLRAYKKGIKTLPNTNDSEINALTRIDAFYNILFKPLSFISKSEIEEVNNKSKEKYFHLVRLSKNLGNAVWLWTKLQLFFLLLGSLFYLTYLMKN